jgi:hypothetical protein
MPRLKAKQKTKRDSVLWVGTFNYSHEIVTRYRYAPSWASAKVRMLRDIAKDHGVDYIHVFGMFDGAKDNYHIEQEERAKR